MLREFSLTAIAAAVLLLPGCAAQKDVRSVRFNDATGRTHSLFEFQGKVVLVDVWATWCPPCRMSLPEIAALQKAQSDDYAVLAISVDSKGWTAINPFLAANPALGLEAVVPFSRGSLATFGAIEGIPTTLVIDRKGRLRERWSGYYPGRAASALKAALQEP